MTKDSLKIFSYNCQGLNSREKRRDVFEYLKSKLCHIYCLQDTHFKKINHLLETNGEENAFLILLLQIKEELPFYLQIILNIK